MNVDLKGASMFNKTPLARFTINGLNFHCGQCKHDDHWCNEPPCTSCVEIRRLDTGGISPIITGKCFEPSDPQYVEKITDLVSQYVPLLREVEQSRNQIRKELTHSAKKLGVKVSDFDFACKGLEDPHNTKT